VLEKRRRVTKAINRNAISTYRQAIRTSAEPEFIEPMQCKPVSALPAGEKWTFEIKFDGYRCIAVKRAGELTLFSRHQKVLNTRFPRVADALALLESDFVLDGELVALDAQGRPSFQVLQNNLSRLLPTYFYCFDLLNRDGETLISFPLQERRQLHKMLPAPEDPLRLSPLLHAPSDQILVAVRKLGLEGIVAKQIDSVYEPGERSGAWIKLRANREQEFVIGGYIPGARGFDALLVGVYEGKELIFVAKVKNGFVPRVRDEIFPALETLRTAKCPFANLPETRALRWGETITAEKMSECRWVKPKLVCQVAFLEWTDAGHLRHSTFVAMCDDKTATQVMREASLKTK
jgi:DNA ligase D-like protein (predicted ligase)